jgi:hypothetical protein
MELALDLLPGLGFLKWSWVMEQLPNTPKLQTLIIDEVFNVKFCTFFLRFYLYILYKNKNINYRVSLSG